jgi:hypothetical protein
LLYEDGTMPQQYPQAIPLTDEEQYLAGRFMPVSSSYCTHIAYNPVTSAIGVQFSDGTKWWYFPFSRSDALSLWHAPSHGEWLWRFTRVAGTVHQHRRGAARAE